MLDYFGKLLSKETFALCKIEEIKRLLIKSFLEIVVLNIVCIF